jgi:hypothetical protein
MYARGSVSYGHRFAAVCFLSAAVVCCSGEDGPDSTPGSTGGGWQATVDAGDAQAPAAGDSGPGDATPQDSAVSCSPTATGDIVFSEPSGTFMGSVSVALSTGVPAAEIRYTTDGSPPTPSSIVYDGAPVSIDGTTQLRAQAYVGGNAQGIPGTALYIERAIDAVHDLPVIVLDAYGSGRPSTTDRSYVDVAFLGFGLVDGSTSLAARPAISSLAAYHVRGQSSVMFDKLSYRIELRDEAGLDRDCELLGMPAEADWALVGPHADKTLVHNAFVYGLGGDMGLAVPRLVLAELYLNVDDQPLASDDYQGVYQVVEIIKNQKNRLDLVQLDPTITTEPDITGGYIFKYEWLAAEPPILQCPGSSVTCWSDLELVDPDPPAAEQTEYLVNHLGAFNDAIHSATPADPAVGYPAYIDVASFVDHVIVNEFTRNMDAYARSQYFYKDRGGKIFAGPLWDFDLIAGVGMGVSPFGPSFPNLETSGWQYESNASRINIWFEILVAEPNFRAQLVQRWRELRQGLLSDASISARIDQVTAGLANAAERNFQRWNILAQATVTPFATPTEPTWTGQVEYMRSWLIQRAAWLDTQWI